MPEAFGLLASHRRRCTLADPTGFKADFPSSISGPILRRRHFPCLASTYIHLTCRVNLAITIPVQTGPVWGCSSVGGSQTSRGRIPRKCVASLQAQSATGRHHQGGQASLLLPEARREEAGERSIGPQAQQEESTQRARLGFHGPPRKRGPVPFQLCPKFVET